MSRSLQINGLEWEVTAFGERSLLIKSTKKIDLLEIHKATRILEKTDLEGVIDIITAYDSIALIYDRIPEPLVKEAEIIESRIRGITVSAISPKKHKIPVCYDLGLDWDSVETYTGLNRGEIIKRHTEAEYTVAMMGFIPGFLYLEGLDEAISCPRKNNPRTKVPAGSIGIAGDQTGIYSLESPGGWQIIGRTPESYFDVNREPPGLAEPGDQVRFYEVSVKDFDQLKEKREVE